MNWQDKLDKKELKHLREVGVTTLRVAISNASHQKQLRDEDGCEPCFTCKHINMKLGLPV